MPIIFEPPADLTGGVPQLWAGLSGGTATAADPNWGGAAIFASTDNATYVQVGTMAGPARQGVTTTTLGGLPGTTSDTLTVSFAKSAATILPTSAPTLLLVDTEILSFTSATLVAPFTYQLGGLQRGVYGHNGGAHGIGAPALILDKSVFTYTLPLALIGTPIFLKFASFNLFGQAMQSLATCQAYQVTPIGSGYLGPVTQALATGAALDEGLASTAATELDSYGLASDPYTITIDMGLASDGLAALPVPTGGTGATTAAQARANLGAAALGSNSDITSLDTLTAVTTPAGPALTVDPKTGHVGLAGYQADANNALGVTGTACLFAAATDSMRFTFSKIAPANDAALTFQTNFSTRALAGLLGSDGFQLKVSPDGASFYQVFVCDQTNANTAFKALLGLASYSVAALPAAGFNGALAFASNGRKIGEAAGAGSGVVVAFSNGNWHRLSDDTIVAA
jgi:hypothetical protein